MSHNLNIIKSQDDINEGGRKSDVLIATIEELERTKKQLEIAKEYLNERADKDKYADWILLQIEDLNNPCQNCTYTDEYCASGDCKRT